jgi:hypothetical protein
MMNGPGQTFIGYMGAPGGMPFQAMSNGAPMMAAVQGGAMGVNGPKHDMTFHLYREAHGVRVTGEDKRDSVFTISRNINNAPGGSNSLNSWNTFRMHQGPANGPAFLFMSRLQGLWNVFRPGNPNPESVLAYPDGQPSLDRRVFLGPDGMWYEWQIKGKNMECYHLQDRTMVAMFVAPSAYTLLKVGKIYVKRPWQHMQHLLVATGFLMAKKD